MELILQLWLPILVSSVVVFIASSVAWTISPHHKKDIQQLPDEKSFMDDLSRRRIPPGTYMWPNATSAEVMKSDEFQARYQAGPWGTLNVLPARPNMARNLTLVFLFYVVVGVFVAYITGHARQPGTGFLPVFQVAGATAVLAYCAGPIPNAIFFGKPARFVLTDFLDGIVYGLLTGVVFAVLWPST